MDDIDDAKLQLVKYDLDRGESINAYGIGGKRVYPYFGKNKQSAPRAGRWDNGRNHRRPTSSQENWTYSKSSHSVY